MRTTLTVSGIRIPRFAAGLYLRLITRIIVFYGHPPVPSAMRAIEPAWDVARIRASVKPTAVRIAGQTRTAITVESVSDGGRYELTCARDPAAPASDRLRFTSRRYRLLAYEWTRTADGVFGGGGA